MQGSSCPGYYMTPLGRPCGAPRDWGHCGLPKTAASGLPPRLIPARRGHACHDTLVPVVVRDRQRDHREPDEQSSHEPDVGLMTRHDY